MNEFEEFKLNVKTINVFIDSWLKSIGLPQCHAYIGPNFSYDYVNDTITYCFEEEDYEDKLFLCLCKQYKPKIVECDNFIISFLHELGHCMANDNYSIDEWYEYNEFVRQFEDSNPTAIDYINYYRNDIEYSATKWACDFIVNNKDKVNELINGLKLISPSFYQWKDLIVMD